MASQILFFLFGQQPHGPCQGTLLWRLTLKLIIFLQKAVSRQKFWFWPKAGLKFWAMDILLSKKQKDRSFWERAMKNCILLRYKIFTRYLAQILFQLKTALA